MHRQPRQIDSADSGGTRWQSALQWVMAALLILAPLAYGATEPWSQQLAVMLVAVALLCLVADRVQRGAALAWSWTFVPIALFLGLVCLQVVPLPAGVLERLSPATLELKRQLLGERAGEAHTLSFYPHATRGDLMLLLLVVAVFFIVVQAYRDAARLKQLLAVVAAAAALPVALALYHEGLGGGAIYPGGRVNYHGAGPLVNHSHFAQLVNLGIGASFGLMLVLLAERMPRHLDPQRIRQRLGEAPLRPVWVLAGLIVLGSVAVFVTLSRGGMISLMVAAAATTLVMLWRFRGRGGELSVAVLALAALTGLLYWGFDPVYERLASLRQFDQAQGVRWRILEDLWPLWTSFPVFGTGLGSFAYVFPMYESLRSSSLLTYHAENEYAQLMAETGLVGVALAAAFLGMVFAAWWKLARRGSDPIHLAAFGLGFGLLAVLVHSLSDFGQHVPAIAMITAACCGMLVNLAQLEDAGRGRAARRGERRGLAADAPAVDAPVDVPAEAPVDAPVDAPLDVPAGAPVEAAVEAPVEASQDASIRLRPVSRPAAARAGWALGGLAAFAALAWAAMDVDHARQAEAAWARAGAIEARLEAEQWQGPDEIYVRLLEAAETAVALQPGHVGYRYRLNYFRWRSISRVVDPETGELLMTDTALSHTRRIVEALHEARRLCPTYGPLYALAGQLELFVLDEPEAGTRHVRLGHELTSHHGYVSYVAGELAAAEGRWDAAMAKLQRAWRQHGALREPILELLLDRHERPELAYELVAGDRSRLLALARRLEGMPGHEQRAAAYRDEARQLLEAAAERGDRPTRELAELASLAAEAGDHAAAVDYYRRALAHDYGQVGWRYELARSLAELGETEQAMREARLCLRLRPQMDRAKTLLADLSVR